MNIDYSMLRQSPFEGALDPLVAATKAIAERRHQAAQQEERLRFAREQEARLATRDQGIIDRNNRTADLAERRYVGDRTTKNLGTRQSAEAAIREATGRNDYDRAEQIKNSYSEQDPETGSVTTGLPTAEIKRFPAPRDNRFDVIPTESTDSGVEAGPRATSGITKRAAKIRAEEGSFEREPRSDTDYRQDAQAEMKRFNAQQGPQADPSEYQATREAPQAPSPEVRIGGALVDPQQTRYAEARTQAGEFNALRGVLQTGLAQAQETRDPQAIRSAERRLEAFAQLSPAVESGQMSGKDAANKLFGVMTAEYKRDADMEKTTAQGGQRLEQIGLQNEGKVAAAAAGGGKTAADKHGGMDPQVENVKLARIRLFNTEVENMAKRHDLPADTRNLQRAIMNVDSANSDNSVLQAAAQFGVARDITGGGGQSLSNKDVAMVAPRAGGIERLQGLAGRLIEGDQLSDAEKKVLAEAIRHGMDFAKQRLGAFQDDYVATFDNDDLPWRQQLGRKHIMGALRRYIPQSEAKKGDSPAAPRATARPAPAGGGPVKVKAGNPDDPNDDGPLDDVQLQPNAITEEDARARAQKAGLNPDVAVRNLRAKGMIK